MNPLRALPVTINRSRRCACALLFTVILGCTGEANDTAWTIDAVRSDSGRSPVGVLAVGTEVSVGESQVEFRLGGVALTREAEVDRTKSGARIKLDVGGSFVTLEFERFDDEHGQLRWVSRGHAITADLSRGDGK
jgi:hypothetical protein